MPRPACTNSPVGKHPIKTRLPLVFTTLRVALGRGYYNLLLEQPMYQSDNKRVSTDLGTLNPLKLYAKPLNV